MKTNTNYVQFDWVGHSDCEEMQFNKTIPAYEEKSIAHEGIKTKTEYEILVDLGQLDLLNNN